MNFGEPQDVDGECNAHLYIADNFGDNHATMRCGLPKGHTAHHQEIFKRDGRGILVQWEGDERTMEEEAKKTAEDLIAFGKGLGL